MLCCHLVGTESPAAFAGPVRLWDPWERREGAQVSPSTPPRVPSGLLPCCGEGRARALGGARGLSQARLSTYQRVTPGKYLSGD